jgi:hypothetical protein
MKTNTILFITIAVLLGVVVYLLLNAPVQTTVSREYVPVVYEDTRPRDTVIVGGWGGWGFPTKPWGGHHPPPPPPPPSGGGAPPPPPPPAPPAESPATFMDMSKNEKEGFMSTAASYPFA